MKCPDCSSALTVLETRHTASTIRRRRECTKGHRFTTEETIVADAEGLSTRLSTEEEQKIVQARLGGLRVEQIAAHTNVCVDTVYKVLKRAPKP